MQNITDEGAPNLSDVETISEQSAERLSKYQARPGDLVVTKIGFLGRATVLPNDFALYVFRREMTKCIPLNETEYMPAFLAAFFNGRYGRSQFYRYASGTTRDRVLLISQRKILVPRFSNVLQRMIKACFEKSQAAQRKAEELTKYAERILLQALGLKGWQPPEPLTYTRRASEVFAARRLDAEYFHPRYKALFDYIKSHAVRCKHIEVFTNFCERGKQPDYFEEGALSVINSRHILENRLDYDNFERTLEDYWIRNDFACARVYYGDILTYTTGANVGRTAIYLEKERALASNHVNILRVRENPHYICIVMNSMIGRWQTERLTSGSAQVELYPRDIISFVIPFADSETQKNIAELVVQSHEAHIEAREFLERSKHAVEIAIEQNEETALAYLDEVKI